MDVIFMPPQILLIPGQMLPTQPLPARCGGFKSEPTLPTGYPVPFGFHVGKSYAMA